jgi:uncharacterized RDD family membrane protein YckC
VPAPPVATLVPCPNHPDITEGLGACGVCGRNFCGDCLVRLGGLPTCAECKLERLASLRSGAELPLAGAWTRFGAQFVDGLVFFIPTMLLYYTGFFFSPWSALVPPGTTPPKAPPAGLLWLSVALTFTVMAAAVVYEALMLSKYGQTLGKMALGVKVVTPSGGDVRPGQAWTRAVSRSVMNALYCVGVIDVLFIFSASRRTLHDRLAQTVVVNWKR